MNKIINKAVLALVIGASANSYASNLSDKFYLGINGGLSLPFYKNDIKNETFTGNLGLTAGQGFGAYGVEANALFLSYQKYTDRRLLDWMIGANFYYNFAHYDKWTFRALGGLYGIKSNSTNYANNRTQHLCMKLGPQIGVGAHYPLSDNIAFTASLNYLKPIMHDYLTDVVYTSLGINFYI